MSFSEILEKELNKFRRLPGHIPLKICSSHKRLWVKLQKIAQLIFTCPKLGTETVERGAKYVQS